MRAKAKSLYFLGECNQLKIPFFQRRYIWTKKNWDELLNSFRNKEVVPFLGSLILKEDRGNDFSVIDGQQRLTTITILAKAIYDCLPESSKQGDSGVKNCAQNFLFYRKNSIDPFSDAKVKVEHSKNDRKDYERILKATLQNNEVIDIDTINESSSNILRCYKYYVETLRNEPVQTLIDLYSSIFDRDRRIFVVIVLEHGDVNEQSIFDTINRAGEKLTIADIIKNNLYKHLLTKCQNNPIKEHQVHDCYDQCWEDVFCCDQKTSDMWDEKRSFGNVKHTNLEFLLYCIACIKWGEDKDMFPDLAIVYEREISRMDYFDLLKLANEIKEYAAIFTKYIQDLKRDLEDEEKSVYFKYDDHVSRLMLILNKFKVQMFYPYVLMRLHDVDQNDADAQLISDFKKLESFIVRRKISTRGTHDYTSKCYQIIQYGIDYLRDSDFSNTDGKISDYEVKQYLANTKDDAAKMILFCIELYRRREKTVDVKALEYTYTLEHIMPRNWTKEWMGVEIYEKGVRLDPLSDDGKQYRKLAIDSLGNKTLLTGSLNSAIKNGSFTKKINGDGPNKPGYEAHTSLYITREIVDAAKQDLTWDESRIESRLDRLYSEFLVLWPMYAAIPAPVVNMVDEDPVLENYTEEQLDNPLALLSAVPCTVTGGDRSQEQTVADSMITLEEFETMVSAQPETIERYMREGKIVADATVPVSEHRERKYFKLETVKSYIEQFGWVIINDTNRKQLFMDMVQQMDMSYSYKPVFLKAVLKHADNEGCVKLDRVVSYFLNYYKKRRNAGVTVEKDNSVFVNPDCSEADAEKVILKYPYDRFRTMQVLTLDAESAEIRFNKNLWAQLSDDEKMEIEDICDQKLIVYFSRL